MGTKQDSLSVNCASNLILECSRGAIEKMPFLSLNMFVNHLHQTTQHIQEFQEA
jgi:hypothetical protein